MSRFIKAYWHVLLLCLIGLAILTENFALHRQILLLKGTVNAALEVAKAVGPPSQTSAIESIASGISDGPNLRQDGVTVAFQVLTLIGCALLNLPLIFARYRFINKRGRTVSPVLDDIRPH